MEIDKIDFVMNNGTLWYHNGDDIDGIDVYTKTMKDIKQQMIVYTEDKKIVKIEMIFDHTRTDVV